MADVKRAAQLMEEALKLLDGAGEGHAAAMLDHAVNLLPPESNEVRKERRPWPKGNDESSTGH